MNYDEFLRGMKGPMNERRMAMTKRCFDYMDKDGSGQLTIEVRLPPALCALRRLCLHPPLAPTPALHRT